MISQTRLLSLHYGIRTVILLGFAGYIVYLTKSDALHYYIAPKMMIYVKASAVALYIVACFQGYAALRTYWGHRAVCGCEHPPSRSVLRNLLAYGLLILPLLVGFLLPDTVMNSALAAKKGMNLTAAKTSVAAKAGAGSAAAGQNSGPTASPGTAASSAMAAGDSATSGGAPAADGPAASGGTAAANGTAANPADPADAEQLFKAEQPWDEDFAKLAALLYKQDLIVAKPDIYMEILSSIDLFKERFIGKKIEISGFVYREEGLKDDQFIVGRFAMQCCSADASPYGVLASFPTARTYEKDTWVKVTGTIDQGVYADNDIFTIKAEKIEKIAAPESPYVYPNFEPLAAFSSE